MEESLDVALAGRDCADASVKVTASSAWVVAEKLEVPGVGSATAEVEIDISPFELDGTDAVTTVDESGVAAAEDVDVGNGIATEIDDDDDDATSAKPTAEGCGMLGDEDGNASEVAIAGTTMTDEDDTIVLDASDRGETVSAVENDKMGPEVSKLTGII